MDDCLLTSMAYDWNKIFAEDLDFDENKWEDLINFDEEFKEVYTKSINTKSNSNVFMNKKDLVKSSIYDLKRSSFVNSKKFIYTGRSMSILTPPSPYQRVRYENECKKILRYVSTPTNKTMTIKIPDLRDILAANEVLWLRITRTTINHRKDGLIFYHPYPIWIKNKHAKIHNGSIFIPITNKDVENGFINIDTLVMIRLKQDDLAKINTLVVYSSNQLGSFDLYPMKVKTAKCIRDEYKLRQSILNFHIVWVGQNNTAHLTDCLCHTEPIQEQESNRQQVIKADKVEAEIFKDIDNEKSNNIIKPSLYTSLLFDYIC